MSDFDGYLEGASKAFSEQIKVADQKAAYVLTVVLALTVTSQDVRSSFQIARYQSGLTFEALLSLGMVVSAMTAFVAALLVLRPQIRTATNVHYWNAWPEAGERLSAAKSTDDATFVSRDMMQSAVALSEICRKKFGRLKIAFAALLMAAIFYAAILATAIPR